MYDALFANFYQKLMILTRCCIEGQKGSGVCFETHILE